MTITQIGVGVPAPQTGTDGQVLVNDQGNAIKWADGAAAPHNNLTGLNEGDYQHLTAAQFTSFGNIDSAIDADTAGFVSVAGSSVLKNVIGFHLRTKYNSHYYVSTTGSDSNNGQTAGQAFLTIQHAIDTAPAYSTVVVGEGTFEITDQIIIEKPIYLLGSGRDNTTIQVQTGVEERCLWIKEQHDVVVEGIHFTGGRKRTSGTGDSLSGGGVYIGGPDGWGTSPAVIGSCIVGCKVTDCNTIGTGGGIALHDYKSAAVNCIIQNCAVVSNGIGAGGGIYLRYEGYAYGCYIENCTAAYGGGITAQNGVSRVENCTITNNAGSNIVVYGATLYMVNNIIKFPASGSDVAILSGSAVAHNNCTSYNAGNNGNFNSDPLFDGGYGLLPASPCIGAGIKLGWSDAINDLDDTKRDDVSIGCYEYKSTSDHNQLANLQGGTTSQYYHMTSAQHTIATQAASATAAGYVNTSAQTFAGVKTFTSIPVISRSAADAFINFSNGTLNTNFGIASTGVACIESTSNGFAIYSDGFSNLQMNINSAGLVSFGTTPLTGTRVTIKGTGATNATTCLYGLNSASVNTFYIDDSGSMYLANNMSALSITDRTPYPKDLQTAIDAVNSMERLPAGQYEDGNKKKQVNHAKLHPYIKHSANERDLSATVSVHNEVIKYLLERIEALEKK